MCRVFTPFKVLSLFTSIAVCGVHSQEPSKIRPWNDYRTILWIGDSAARHPEKLTVFLQRLREMGINTAMVYSDSDPEWLVKAQFPYYVENMVNRGLCLKFNSSVQDWDKTVTDWARNGRRESALVRDYCLDDRAWLDSARSIVERIARKNAPSHPVAYNIRDELSTTISANPFDYDFNPLALAQFRAWLKTQYADLAALNAEWSTRFDSWEQVRPFTTDEIKNRMASGEAQPRGKPDWQKLQQLRFSPTASMTEPTRWNFSPWADFRSYMDLSLARALESLRAAAHQIDPETPVGIEGTQMPDAFGGYDLWRLSQVLDWVEPYDIAGAREVFGSFMPNKPILTTVFESETRAARRRLWHLLLEGDRACLIWWSEDCLAWKDSGWELTSKGSALAPVLKEMSSALPRLFLRAEPERDPIFIHYSQASIQADWLLESTMDGSTWLRRFSSFESEHNQMGRTRVAWLKALQDLGFSPQFLSTSQIESGALTKATNAVLVLPESLAVTDTELEMIGRSIREASLHLLVEGPAGSFDGHAKLRDPSSRAALGAAATNTGCMIISAEREVRRTDAQSRNYLRDRLKGTGSSGWYDWLKTQVAYRRPEISVPTTSRVRIHRFRTRNARLVAFERNIDYQMSEDLKQAGGNQALETELKTEAALRDRAHVYDLRAGKYLGVSKSIQFTLDPWQPSVFALLPENLSRDVAVEEFERLERQ
jgi:hypothetical protein